MTIQTLDSLDDFRSNKNGADYTLGCGWIDWTHASSDRSDLVSIWSQLPYPNFLSAGQLAESRGPKSTQLDTVSLTSVQLKSVKFYEVQFTPETDVIAQQRIDDCVFLVRKQAVTNLGFCKRAALTMFQFGSEIAEEAQITESSWSYEDLVSNLMAFYMHVNVLDQTDILIKANGWANRDLAFAHANLVFEAMKERYGESVSLRKRGLYPDFKETTKGLDDRWSRAYLFNHLVDIPNADKRWGWEYIPDFFRQVKPLPVGYLNLVDRYGDLPSQDIIYVGSARLNRDGHLADLRPDRDLSRFMAQQQRFQPTGHGRGLGRSLRPPELA